MAIGNENTIRLGIIGNIISVFLFLSPIPTFLNVWKWKSTRGYSGFSYPMTLLNCGMWVLYNMPLAYPSNLVSTVNTTGMFLEAVYTIVFLIFSRNRNERIKVMGFLGVILLVLAAVMSLLFTLENSLKTLTSVIGTMCIVFNVFMYAAPLTIMKRVIQTQSVKYMPFCLSLGCFASGLIWTLYGCLLFDIYIVVPNGLGTLLGTCQLILYGVYYRSTRWDEEDEYEESDQNEEDEDEESGRNGDGNSQPMNGNGNSQPTKNLVGMAMLQDMAILLIGMEFREV